jgi:hypothetical protein
MLVVLIPDTHYRTTPSGSVHTMIITWHPYTILTTMCRGICCQCTHKPSKDIFISVPANSFQWGGGRKGKASPVTSRGVSTGLWWDSHISYIFSSQMAVRLSAFPRAGCALPPGRFLALISVRHWVKPRTIVQLEELCQLKNPMTSLGIKPTTFWLVA